ncbi:hypothetical protein AX17_001150 [Amanita inopinata Kibby_2008]|nr:hypothetical protein AX17_001150 [Amanita inopinata Kibby_2008]
MDNDLTFGASVWGSSDPVDILPPSKTTGFITTDVPLSDDTQFIDDFDDFTTPAESIITAPDDDEFGDFGDFGEAQTIGSVDFDNADFGQSVASPFSPYDWQPLKLHPVPSRAELELQVNEALAPIWGDASASILTDESIREMEGISQVLVTASSREVYKMLLQPPSSTRPPNWTRSRIRRQHLISLGIPVNLDEVLPHASGRPLPPLQITSRPMSAPPPQRSSARQSTTSSASHSRAGTPQPVPSHFGPKPDLDLERIEKLLSLDTETLNLLPLSTLEQRLNELRTQTTQTSALLTHLLQTRESLQQDSETYNRLIAELGDIIRCSGLLTMNISHPIPSSVAGISFSFLTSQDIRRISVKQIINPVLLDDLNRPNIGGLYDPALGPSDQKDICETCRLTYFTCPGHFGHVELPAPVFHPLFMVHMYHLLRGTCLFCHKFKMSRVLLCKYVAKLRLLERGLLDAAQGVDDLHLITRKKVKKKSSKVGGNAENSSDGEDVTMDTEEAEIPDETVEQFMRRINFFVAVHLARSPSSKRDHYKDTLVYQTRKEVINEFLKATVLNKCQNGDCGSPAYTFRKEGYTKIIEYDLSAKQKAQLIRIRPNVLLMEKAGSYVTRQSQGLTNDMDVDEPMTEDEGEGEDLGIDSDRELEDLSANGAELPRAANGKIKTKRGRNERVMAPEECRAHLRLLFKNEFVPCSLIYGRHGPFSPLSQDQLCHASADMFFMDVIPVSPTRFRPPAKMGDTLFEHPQNELLSKVLSTSYRMRDLNLDLRSVSQKTENHNEADRRKLMSELLDCLVQLQVDVNSFIDSSKNPTPVRQGKLPPAGVKQGLEKKEGLFRKHMMGKRVNYAARSVISPDVNIEPNEIGVPPVFARKLTFPEPVTPFNIHELRQLVISGPNNYPGASMVEYEDGHRQSLDKLTIEQRTAIANQLLTPQEGTQDRKGAFYTRTATVNKKVYRHLRDGDILILNRQPTLHKPSMMAHKARVLQGEKTIRMHYANCNSYNADFDGDEMNLHFPQNQVARAEAMMIANTDNQYLVPTSGNPLRGLIQDHVVAGVWMTSQDTFFSREEYFQLLYGALRPEEGTSTRLITLPPSIWKPKPLWTGKQIISTILKNITPEHIDGLNLEAKTKIPSNLWGKDSKEDKVVVMEGELLCGVLDKAAFGASDYGLVHSIYELYGAEIAGKLLGILSRLFTKFLQHRAFTCRMDDLILNPEGDQCRTDILQKGKNLGTEAAIENFPSLSGKSNDEVPAALTNLLQEVLRDDNKMAGLDVTVKTKLSKLTSSIFDACIPHNLLRKFPYNHMQTMTVSGAKGSAVNARQISCALGQQELEGRRVPVMVSGKTLPSFKPFETKAIAGGYVASRFLTGIKPQEFYFHCMAGREGLIDTAVKTSRSGYLQRCLIKHLEGIHVHYDNTVRGSDNAVYQFQYGGDALDVTKQKHLLQFDFIAQNEMSFVQQLKPRQLEDVVDDKTAVQHMKKILKKSTNKTSKGSRSKRDKYDTALSLYDPNRFLGSTSEHFAAAVDRYIKTNPQHLLKTKDTPEPVFRSRRKQLSANNFRLLMNVKYMRSLVEPGEAVGLLASQSVGEPSTQMTLNTFHFAGHGAANVTLGIPRLREIVMTASQKPKTPSMSMKVKRGVSQQEVDLFCKQASRVALSQLVDDVTVKEKLKVEGEARRTQFTVEIKFFPREEYESEYNIEPSEILAAFAVKFPLTLKKETQNEMKRLDADLKNQIADLGKGRKISANREDEGEGEEDEERPRKKNADDESEVEEGNADDEKRARQRKEQATYDSDDENEDDEAYDEVAIEAAYARDDGESQAEENAAITTTASRRQLSTVSDMFHRNLHHAISFDFSDSRCIFKLEFSSDMPKLLFVGIVERTCRTTVVREIPGITDCFCTREDIKGNEIEIKLTTNGSNLRGVWEFSAGASENILEENEIYSNDIYAILKTYGVEMARAAILREMGAIFGAYSIQVDRRHLELIADYMARNMPLQAVCTLTRLLDI